MMKLDNAIARGEPAAFFGQFSSLVLVANSPAAGPHLESGTFGERPLFVFFNKVFRILDEPFAKDCILVSRSSPVGSSLIYRKELGAVMKLLDTERFHGIVNFRAGPEELLSLPKDFGRTDVANLDLTDRLSQIYTPGKLPSTGFAMIIWLAAQDLSIPIVPIGFTGVREDQWRVYDVHDWTWEQIVLSVLYSKSVLERPEGADAATGWPLEAIAAAIPAIERADLDRAATQVLARRLSAANRSIDQIFSAIKLQVGLGKMIRAVRPKSRKARAREVLKRRIDSESAK